MRKIRRGVFETNSSSSHSITMGGDPLDNPEFLLDVDDRLFITRKIFDTDHVQYFGASDRLSYLFSMYFSSYEDVENIISPDDVGLMEGPEQIICKAVFDLFKCSEIRLTGEGHVDHKADEVLDEYLYSFPDGIKNFITGPYCVITNHD